MSGENADAVAAYTQADLQTAWKQLGMREDDYPETWISLPRNRWPKDGSWDHIADPICILKRNLYGHPLAGLIWEKHCHHHILSLGFEPVPSWECLFQHKDKQLFLSIYVDDFKMAGNAANLKPMWEAIGKRIELEEATPFHQSNYLGCQQYDVEPDLKLLEKKTQLIEDILRRKSEQIDQKTNALDAKDLDKIVGQRGETQAGRNKGQHGETQAGRNKVKSYVYDMHGHAEASVERYIELAAPLQYNGSPEEQKKQMQI